MLERLREHADLLGANHEQIMSARASTHLYLYSLLCLLILFISLFVCQSYSRYSISVSPNQWRRKILIIAFIGLHALVGLLSLILQKQSVKYWQRFLWISIYISLLPLVKQFPLSGSVFFITATVALQIQFHNASVKKSDNSDILKFIAAEYGILVIWTIQVVITSLVHTFNLLTCQKLQSIAFYGISILAVLLIFILNLTSGTPVTEMITFLIAAIKVIHFFWENQMMKR